MLNHVMIGTNDIERAKAFYDTLLATLGAKEGIYDTNKTGHKRVFYRHNGSTFMLSQPIDGQEATCANGFTLGFKCESPEQVKEFHDVGVAAGGVSIEEPPGPRESGVGVIHLSYVRDPDGHKLCAIYRESAKK